MPSGPLTIIGGAEDKLRRRTIRTEFVGAGDEARIAVIATAGRARVPASSAGRRPRLHPAPSEHG